MAAPAVLPRRPTHPVRPRPGSTPTTALRSAPADARTSAAAVVPASGAVAYQRVLHQVVRRELRLLADLAAWAAPADPRRTAALARHAELIARVLLQHHDTERRLLWPALERSVPASEAPALRGALSDWSARCALVDAQLRDLCTAARQWTVSGAPRARNAFATACLALADAVEEQTAEEERTLLPLLGAHLDPAAWRQVTRAARSDLSAGERMFVLGLALEDACAAERARLLSALPPGRRWAWRLLGRGRYRAAVVRLRGAPPAG